MRLPTSSVTRGVAAVIASAAVVAAMAATIPAQAGPSSPGSPAAVNINKPGAQTSVDRSPNGRYIVRLDVAPVSMYTGGIDGLAPTTKNGVRSAKISTAAVDAYKSFLSTRRAQVLAAVPGVKPFYTYDVAFAGFAATLTYEQAQTLATTDGVAAVTPDQIYTINTSHSPHFLGLDAEGGLWEQLGGPEGAGEGVVIGDLDTGFSPDSGSFAPLEEPAPVPDGWSGTCDPGDATDFGGGRADGSTGTGDQNAAIECQGDVFNNKVIGARWYHAGGDPLPQEFLSPRDLNGHGSHTGSTAGGDHGVDAIVAGADLGKLSGMAPRARLAVYKICWEQVDATAGCAGSDSLAAIDDAISDGVNVINYSIGGSVDSAADPVALAFMGAASAGIFVSASAGNDGTVGSTAHNYPWVTTVAASTMDRAFHVKVTGGDGDSWVGAGIATAVPETAAVWAGNIPAEGHATPDAAKCYPDAIDPDKAKGKIIICDRGFNARVQKSEVVKKAGGVGMILANDFANGDSLVTERHSVPTSHVTYEDGLAIKKYVNNAKKPTLQIDAFEEEVGDGITAPEMASFSSRGPGGVADADLLKPDITAPGVDVIASLAPYDDNYGETYGFESGTSMSSPHIAGIAALMVDLHPDWTPMMIKSALMTSAYQYNNQGKPIERLGEVATPFEYGAGHVNPNPAADSPLVYATGLNDWVQFLCGTELPNGLGEGYPTCDEAGGAIAPSSLNEPSIAVGSVTGFREVQRTVTNVTDHEVTATQMVEEPDGYKLTVTPDELTIPAGGTAEFTVRIEQTTAPLDEWQFGAVHWMVDDAVVRIPVAMKAVSFKASELVVGGGSTGSATDTVLTGTSIDVNIAVQGLAPAQVDEALLKNPDGSGFPTGDPHVNDHVMEGIVDVPDGATIARFELFSDDYVPGTDLDMFVYKKNEAGTLDLVGQSATSIANERFQIEAPAAGEYHIFVDLYSLAPGEQECDVFLHSFVVSPDGGVGDFAVDPDQFHGDVGDQTQVTYSWSGLAGPDDGMINSPSGETMRYLGIADFTSGEDDLGRTIVRVDVTSDSSPTPTETETSPTPTATETGSNSPTPTGTLPGTGAGSSTRTLGIVGLAALVLGGVAVFFARRRLDLRG
jgi:LPXTG-motif cell wall-anchored protein